MDVARWLSVSLFRSSIVAMRPLWILWHTGCVPDGWSDRRDALPQGCVLRDYTIQAVLGHGGFGIVYKARHNELDQVVAIKEYLPSELAVREGATVRAKSADCETYFADGLRRFREEAKALIDFQRHPSTVACSEFFRANGTAYLVMEYVFSQARLEVNSYIEFSRGWDGSDGLPPSQVALDESLNLLSKLEWIGVVEPKTMLENDGEIGLYWRTDRCYLEIGVIGDGDWGAYGINRSTKNELMIDHYPTDKKLPESLVKFLQGVNLL